MRKKLLLAAIVIIIAISYLVYQSIKTKYSYIAFENTCIKQKGSINVVVERTLDEFPECKLRNNGSFNNSNFQLVNCGNTPLNPANFIVIADENSCQILSRMDMTQRIKIISQQ